MCLIGFILLMHSQQKLGNKNPVQAGGCFCQCSFVGGCCPCCPTAALFGSGLETMPALHMALTANCFSF